MIQHLSFGVDGHSLGTFRGEELFLCSAVMANRGFGEPLNLLTAQIRYIGLGQYMLVHHSPEIPTDVLEAVHMALLKTKGTAGFIEEGEPHPGRTKSDHSYLYFLETMRHIYEWSGKDEWPLYKMLTQVASDCYFHGYYSSSDLIKMMEDAELGSPESHLDDLIDRMNDCQSRCDHTIGSDEIYEIIEDIKADQRKMDTQSDT